jgi:hypothetical protein
MDKGEVGRDSPLLMRPVEGIACVKLVSTSWRRQSKKVKL